MLYKKGISSNYNEPMKYEQIKRMPEQKIRDVYNAIISTNNLVNVQTTKGADLGIIDKDKYEYILTYSFPCQDLSLAGKRAGMNRDENTRSGMLWEVERILKECNELNQLPQVLLMENVPQVCGAGNEENFVEWQQELEKLGYKSYFEVLNAKDYGIPQNRERCFMVSILGDYSYSFPKKIPLKLKLKDMLEENVDEKYYLSDKMLKGMLNTTFESYKLENKLLDKDGTCNTIIARFDGCPQCIEDNNLQIKEDTIKGYAEAYDGDGVYINRPHQKRGVVQKDMIQTLKTSLDVGVVVKDKINIIGNYSPSNHNARRIVDTSGISPTVMGNHNTVTAILEDNYEGMFQYSKSDKFMGGRDRFTPQKELADCLLTNPKEGVVVKDKISLKKDTQNYIEREQKGRLDCDCRAWKENCVAPTTTTTPKTKVLLNNLRIRKLTPKECYRLMGFDDEDYENAKKVLSDSMIYHTAGDSIVVPVIEHILKQML